VLQIAVKYNYEKKVYTVMINNATNINKTNNHLSPQNIEHKKRPQYIYDAGNGNVVKTRCVIITVASLPAVSCGIPELLSLSYKATPIRGHFSYKGRYRYFLIFFF